MLVGVLGVLEAMCLQRKENDKKSGSQAEQRWAERQPDRRQEKERVEGSVDQRDLLYDSAPQWPIAAPKARCMSALYLSALC